MSEVINLSLTEFAARGTVPTDVDQVNIFERKGKRGKDGKGKWSAGTSGKGKTEKGKGQGDERKCFHCDGSHTPDFTLTQNQQNTKHVETMTFESTTI